MNNDKNKTSRRNLQISKDIDNHPHDYRTYYDLSAFDSIESYTKLKNY